ncbi:uncharacterized protein K460DRAFT_388023 [Cucurbitaria berberidis CBS 394.84]|uniref:Uncharacterized protein n=1 Tax=Cucurbitaria berberidis CBS 394.84 TaxID=1168544 RepID=A0A9P4GDV9_9PLEO|nr:uncharacterized protein K460DRAFT_388023 [Cucurbitaria berberidis CBS 394.84]KAF1844128.1 hypothetical protein K460DRAFT_388023 [Cucurbitaria berberidis CBS 394.84]
MATTAHAVPNLDISAPEEMDLHSDSGLDFGDGDIELDLEPAPPTQHQNDDVSINDAASTGDLDVQTAPADQDDFMADHEDFIEEDYTYGDDGVVVADQYSTNNLAPTQTESLAPPDEDLIDYSDDEGQQTQKNVASTLEHDQFEVHAAQDEALPAEQDNTEDITQAFRSANDENVEQHDQDSPDRDQVDQSAKLEGVDLQDEASNHQGYHSEAHDEENENTDGEDGGVLLRKQESLAGDDEHEVAHEDSEHPNTATDEEHQNHQSVELQPVTVNYAGNELWLFKQHDADDSGDWLLDDLSLAKSSMSDLFQACRSSLGDDVSHEHEIGFRFDHLHNLELYEDNTVCVAVSLERMVGLYHTLQAQDGNTEPESFYVSLLFRPRFATLLSDVAKYAEQGSGYSGLDAAVAAGETHFSNLFSGSSTENEPNDWENEEQKEADRDDTEQINREAQQEVDQAEHVEQEPQTNAEPEDNYDREDDDDDAENDNESTSADNVFHQEQDDHDASPESANTSDVPTDQVGQLDAQHSQSQSETAVESDARREQKEDDLIDYSDEDDAEDAEDAQEAEHTYVEERSPLSSTVQGDEPATAEDGAHTAGSPEQSGQDHENNDELDSHVEDDNGTHFNDQLLEGIDDTTQSYQNYAQAFDQDDSFQDFQADGDANQDYAGFEYQTLDQQLQLNFLDGAEFNAGDSSTMTGNNFTGTNDFLDLNNASEWVTEQESVSNLPEGVMVVHDDTTTQVDEEDGTAKPSAVAASSTADPVAASSTEFQKSSPQGQKRSIDEAGYGVDDALDSIGMLAHLLSMKRSCKADFVQPDAKRPKV